MKINILAGNSTDKICNALVPNNNFEVFGEKNLSKALREVNLTEQPDTLILFDTAFIENGRQLDIKEVFEALMQTAVSFKKMEILIITKNTEIYELFRVSLEDCTNTRCEVVSSITTKLITDCILNKSINQKKDELTEEEQPVQSEPPLVSIPDEPLKNTNIKSKEEVSKQKSKRSLTLPPKKNTEKIIVDMETFKRAGKVIIVTGNPNSGVTGTAFFLAKTVSMAGIKVEIFDLDTSTKGLNLYSDGLDNSKSTHLQKKGAILALENPLEISDISYSINSNLSLLGVSSESNYEEMLKPFSTKDIQNLLTTMRTVNNVVIVHIPIEVLTRKLELIESCDYVLYCCKSNINSIMSIDSYIGAQEIKDKEEKIFKTLLQRKLFFVLCDYFKDSYLSSMDFLSELFRVTAEETLHRPVAGVIPHVESYDNYSDTKTDLTEDKELIELFKVIISNMIK